MDALTKTRDDQIASAARLAHTTGQAKRARATIMALYEEERQKIQTEIEAVEAEIEQQDHAPAK